jgi:hypothetical protein
MHLRLQWSGLPGASHLFLNLVLLMFSSAHGQFVYFTGAFCDALRRADFPQLKYTMAQVALLAGEVFLLRIAIGLLEKAVSIPFWGLGAG